MTALRAIDRSSRIEPGLETGKPMSRLDRFREAQNSSHAGFESALAELRSGGKRGHWIWYVFPQIDGLGMSGLSQAFAIDGEEEAAAFLRDAELRSRLLTITSTVAEQLSTGRVSSLRTLDGLRHRRHEGRVVADALRTRRQETPRHRGPRSVRRDGESRRRRVGPGRVAGISALRPYAAAPARHSVMASATYDSVLVLLRSARCSPSVVAGHRRLARLSVEPLPRPPRRVLPRSGIGRSCA